MTEIDYDQIIDKFKSNGANINEEIVQKALEFAVKYHSGQTRSSGEDYHHHPIAVAEIISEMRLDTDSIVTAILHDTVEDTELTLEEIEHHFSPTIARLVDGVTKLAKIKFKADNVRQAENFRKLLVAMSDDIRVLLVKLADRLHNMRTIEFLPKPEKQKRIALETMELYAPLAERIGMQQIKVELQDICFGILHPEVKDSILNRFKHIESDKEDYIDDIIIEIKKLVTTKISNASVTGRKKTPYSTWMKMKQKNVGIDQLSDIIAFRVIVDKIEDCYNVLGMIHSEYKMVPGNFQDFISTPKNNGYQSLHTVVIGPMMQKIEVQIRTQEMHDVAELGVAAHWRYKQKHEDPSDGKNYTWLRELLFIIEQNSAPEDMLKNTKMAMYYDQVFCFTPDGNLIALPKGATVVDFAYMVDSDIGNHCLGARINNKELKPNAELINGNQVEVILSETICVKPEWENFVATGKARAEIKKQLNAMQHEQYESLGKNIITEAFKANEISDVDAAMNIVCNYFKKNQEEVFYATGRGDISRTEILEQVLPKKTKLIDSTLQLLKFKKQKIKKVAAPIGGIVSGMALSYAKCCYPLPGDKITGVVHTGSGITIHTSDCTKLENYVNEPERTISLQWNFNVSDASFICRLNVTLINEPNSLAVFSTEVAKDGGNIINFTILNRGSEYYDMYFDIEVKSSYHINSIINSLKTKKIVQTIHRARS